MGYKLLYFSEGDLIDVIHILYVMCLALTIKFQRFKQSCTPDKKWGPAREENRKEWMDMVMKRKVQSIQVDSFTQVYNSKLLEYRADMNDDVLHKQFIELAAMDTAL